VRELLFQVKSLGSAKPATPAAEELGSWVRQHVGIVADLITWEIEKTIKSQGPKIEFPAAGGMWYCDRMLAAFSNISQQLILGEFDLQTADIAADCVIAAEIRKGCRWAIPSPQALHLNDDYFKDEDMALEAIADAMTRMCRTMRDNGAAGHVLLYDDAPDAIDLERFSGKQFLRYVPDAFLENILEVQQDLILSANAVPLLTELADCYVIRRIYIAEPTIEALTEACRQFDPNDVYCAGTAPETDQDGYWEGLAELRIQVGDI
jgi:hypothetical protein